MELVFTLKQKQGYENDHLKMERYLASSQSMPRLNLPSLDSRPTSPKPMDTTSLSFPLGTRTFGQLSGSRTYTQLEQGLDSIFRTPEPMMSRQRIHTPSMRALTKSHSRASLFEEETVDDLEVYHTITGGKNNPIAASRQPLPFAKIMRRPAQLAARMDSVDGKKDFEGLLDIESVEEDHNEITEEETFIQSALSQLDLRHSTEMDMLQRKMEELQRHYMQEKETLRVDLVQTLFNTRKLQQQDVPCSYPAQPLGHGEGLESEGLSPAMLQLQQEQQRIQQQIQAQLRQEQRGQQQIAGQAAVFSPPPTSQLMQPAPRYTMSYQLASQPHLVTLANGQTVQLVQGPMGAQQIVNLPSHSQQFLLPQEQLLAPRPQSFAPTRVSPRQFEDRGEEEERLMDRLDCASVMSEPGQAQAQQMKRDSFSDSGAEGSGTNTPTRGRTMTDGLLRFVQDGSVVRPIAESQKRHPSNTEQPIPIVPPIPMASVAPAMAPLHQSGRFSALSNPGSCFSGVQGRDSAPLMAREASVIQPVPMPTHFTSSAASVIQPRYASGQEFTCVTPRPYLAPSPYQPHYLPYPHHGLPVNVGYVPGKSLGSAPIYPQPPLHPHPAASPYMYPQFAGSSQLTTYPPGPIPPHQPFPASNLPPNQPPPASSFQPVAGSEQQHPGVGTVLSSSRQPIMSSSAQPSYPAYPIPVMVVPQHHYLPATPSSPPVGLVAPTESGQPPLPDPNIHVAPVLPQATAPSNPVEEGLAIGQPDGQNGLNSSFDSSLQ